MKRFVKYFINSFPPRLEADINRYAENNQLNIISVTIDSDCHRAMVLFEKEK